jgi:hypothetical protein
MEPLDQHEAQDIIISRVEVARGGIFLVATPDAVSADGVTAATVKAWVYDRAGKLVPDGTAAEFSATLGRIAPAAAATVGGCATTTFIGTTRPDTAVVSARSNGGEQT